MMDIRALIFPGQGSQSVGMLADHIETPIVRQTFEEASEVLGFNLLTLIKDGPAEDLNRTENTQPALLAASVALWRLWEQKSDGLKPAFMAGHSLGEYSALVCAGAMQFSDAVRIVRQRGLFMQEAVPEGTGAMAAILGLDDEKVLEACCVAEDTEVVEAANFNSPGQVVIAGNMKAVERAMVLAKAAGAKRAMLLPVSVPSHCALMKPAAERLAVELNNIELNAPGVPVLHNVTADVSSDPGKIRKNLVEQLYNPVRWVETINRLNDSGVAHYAECGPGKVLAGLNKRIVRRVPVAMFESATAMDEWLADSTE